MNKDEKANRPLGRTEETMSETHRPKGPVERRVRRVIGWRVGMYSASGTGHYYLAKDERTAVALCGNWWGISQLQSEDQIIKKCKRCENSLAAPRA